MTRWWGGVVEWGRVKKEEEEMKFKLSQDMSLRLTQNEEREAYERMARYGVWEGSWWTPNPSQHNPQRRIEGERFVIEKVQGRTP